MKHLARRVYERADGNDTASRGQMILTEKGQPPRIRDMFTFRLEPAPGQVRTLIRFESPADIRGVGMLTMDSPGDETRQHLFLPDLGRTRRISGSRKGGRFVGSDFFYEDLRDRPVELDRHRLLAR